MLPLVEFPEIVQLYAPFFQEVFSPEAFFEIERYVSGLIVSENKTVDGINRLLVVESRNQSSLNRLLTASPFSLTNLNQARLDLLASLPGTQMKPKGVFSIDDTLLTHFGQDFEQIAQLWDHVSGSYVWAHDLVTVHYSDDKTDYPVVFQLWEPVDLEKLEQGMRAAQIPIKASKEILKDTDPQKWRGYLLGVWQRRQKGHPEIRELYDSKLIMVQKLLEQRQKELLRLEGEMLEMVAPLSKALTRIRKQESSNKLSLQNREIFEKLSTAPFEALEEDITGSLVELRSHMASLGLRDRKKEKTLEHIELLIDRKPLQALKSQHSDLLAEIKELEQGLIESCHDAVQLR